MANIAKTSGFFQGLAESLRGLPQAAMMLRERDLYNKYRQELSGLMTMEDPTSRAEYEMQVPIGTKQIPSGWKFKEYKVSPTEQTVKYEREEKSGEFVPAARGPMMTTVPTGERLPIQELARRKMAIDAGYPRSMRVGMGELMDLDKLGMIGEKGVIKGRQEKIMAKVDDFGEVSVYINGRFRPERSTSGAIGLGKGRAMTMEELVAVLTSGKSSVVKEKPKKELTESVVKQITYAVIQDSRHNQSEKSIIKRVKEIARIRGYKVD